MWAIQDQDLELYLANEQYEGTKSITVCTKQGSPAYSARTFRTEEEGRNFLKNFVEHNHQARKTRWKVVPYNKDE